MENTTENSVFWLPDSVSEKFYILLHLASTNAMCGGYWISGTASAPLMASWSPHVFSTFLCWNGWWATAKGLAQLEKCRLPSWRKLLRGAGTTLATGSKEMDTQKWHLPLLQRNSMVFFIYVWFLLSFLFNLSSLSILFSFHKLFNWLQRGQGMTAENQETGLYFSKMMQLPL